MSDFHGQRALRTIADRQREWAALREIEVEDGTSTRRIEDNFFGDGPLCDELTKNHEKPEELRRLDSRVALVSNVFAAWRDRPADAVAAALGSTCEEARLRPGPWTPSHAGGDELLSSCDVLLESPGARPIAIAASFAETYSGGAHRRLAGEYAEPGRFGELHDVRNLALDLLANPLRFRRIEAASLVERCLALSTRHGVRGFRLVHLWYEVPGRAADEMRREIDRFRIRVGADVDFAALSWQRFFSALSRATDDPAHAARVRERYFSDSFEAR